MKTAFNLCLERSVGPSHHQFRRTTQASTTRPRSSPIVSRFENVRAYQQVRAGVAKRKCAMVIGAQARTNSITTSILTSTLISTVLIKVLVILISILISMISILISMNNTL